LERWHEEDHLNADSNREGVRESVETRLERASDEWTAERAKLVSQINRLEIAVAEAIERASNPMRLTQTIKEQFEIELQRLLKDKTESEQGFLRAKTQWEQEKLKMTGEMVKLRRAAQIMGRPVPREDAPEINPKVRDLETRLKENLSQWNAERERLVAQINKLEEVSHQWDIERRQLHDHAGQLQQAFVHAQAKIQSYEIAARSPQLAEVQVEELRREKDTLKRQLREARSGWEDERRLLNSEVERREKQLQRMSETRERISNEVVEQLRFQYEQRLQEAIEQKTQLAKELQSASTMLENERFRLSAAHKGSELDPEKIAAEVSRVEAMLTEIIAVVDNPDTDLSTVIRKNVEKAELDAYLRGIMFTLGKK
jgi:hypothetical protein